MVEGIYDRHSYLAGNLVTVCRQPPNFTARTSDGPELAALYSQAQETCDYYDDNHHTDDVKDVHCVLLRARDKTLLEQP